MITRTDIFLHNGLPTLETKALKFALMKTHDRCGSMESLMQTLRWEPNVIWKIMRSDIQDYPGPIVLALSPDDLIGRSLLAVRKDVRRRIVAALASFGSGREIARLLRVLECEIRRHRD